MKHRNWFWGVFFLAAAVFIIACQVGAFVQIGFWSLAATVLLAAVLVSSLVELNFFGIFVPLALLYFIYQHPLHLIAIPVWQLLLASVLASIGLSMIFHRRHHWCGWHEHWNENDWREHWDHHGKTEETIDGDEIFVKSNFNESCRYLHAQGLRKANLTSSFGKLSVYFDQVKLSPEGAKIYVDASFGEMILYMPKEWRVLDNIRAGFGAVNNDVRSEPAADAPTVTLTGNVSFGHLQIRYV